MSNRYKIFLDRYKLNEKIRFEFNCNQTRVGTIKKVKKGLFGTKYLVTVVYPSSLLGTNPNTFFYWLKEDKIIENLPHGYKGWC
ncbi:hypothetical protein [Clostridium kluyveri]|uniref:Uncharacterized protein n=1 Tax=Clostridium kluyveri (strain ATCC 8527 / DSM 555 / NBRC 12016 / NCIMB 10680 / K1) TaxID=431943 RepID=A5F9N3_CLOK5|nr:hypothetical protein [Clostridium kluyveri]ABQ23623.1 hypothetical protein CKL_4024 [Clostridium kluyveri DSM 555]